MEFKLSIGMVFKFDDKVLESESLNFEKAVVDGYIEFKDLEVDVTDMETGEPLALDDNDKLEIFERVMEGIKAGAE